MQDVGTDEMDEGLSEKELMVFVSFSDLLFDGHDVDPDEFLAQYPGHSMELRAAVEGERLVSDAARKMARQQPGVGMAELMRGCMKD